MHYLNLCPDRENENKKYKFLGILSKNREEWCIADLACLRSSVTIVPFYDSLGPESISYIINQTELTTMCIELKAFDSLVKLKPQCPTLETLICFDEIPEGKI